MHVLLCLIPHLPRQKHRLWRDSVKEFSLSECVPVHSQLVEVTIRSEMIYCHS